MERLVIVAIVVAVGIAVALVIDRRSRPNAPTQPRRSVPSQLDRSDFPEAEAPWLVAVFTSSTCDACHSAVHAAAQLEATDVAVVEVAVETERSIHDRYGIDAVPVITIAGSDGVVERAFVGPPAPGDLQAALAAARDPEGSPSELGRLHPGA